MSEFLSYNPELDEASFSSETKPFFHDKNSPETQISVNLEQVIEFANKIPEIKEFLAQQNLSPEELTDLYRALQKTIKDDPALINLDLVKKITTDILGSGSPTKERRPFHQKALSLVTATLFAFLGPVAFKDRSASAEKKKTAITTEQTATTETIVENPYASYSSFSYDKISPALKGDLTKKEFNANMKRIKNPTSYTDQFSALMQYKAWTSDFHSLEEAVTNNIRVYELEIQRLTNALNEIEPSDKNAKKIINLGLNISYLYEALYKRWYQDLAPNGDVEAIFDENNSLDDLNKQINEFTTSVLQKSIEQKTKTVDWESTKEAVYQLVNAYKIRHEVAMNYFKTHNFNGAPLIFPDNAFYPVPTWKLGD